jgi:thymidylate synthase (FAD)
MIEHIHGTFKFVCSRSCANAIVRHRIASYAQESTVYCNYTKGRFSNSIVCIDPVWGAKEFFNAPDEVIHRVKASYEMAANTYQELLDAEVRLPFARQVLPLGLKTEVIQTINLRSLQNFFSLRVEEFQNPEICYLARKLHTALNIILPEVFDQYLPLHDKTWPADK